MSNEKAEKLIERETIRPLGILYDFIIYAFVFFLLFIMRPSGSNETRQTAGFVLVQFIVSWCPLLAARLFLNLYRQVLRYGNMRALVRLLFSDAMAAVVYLLINRFLPRGYRATVLRAITLAALNHSLCTTIRIVYYYIYNFAKAYKYSTLREICHIILRCFALVDIDSEDIAATVPVKEAFKTKTTQDTTDPINDILRVVRQFQIHGEVFHVLQLKKGYINRTYRIQTRSKAGHIHSYTLQRINTNVFPDVDALMDNFVAVTGHLKGIFLLPGHTEKGSIQSVKLVKDTGKAYYENELGCWRMLSHFTDVYSLDIPDSPETFYHAGLSFGAFDKCMADVPAESINIVIKDFHNTYKRYLDLEKSIEKDPVGRVKEVKKEIAFIRNRQEKFSILSDALEKGIIPARVCHNDCNLNNILFSEETHLPVAIIDLDTVMPGSPLYDFGDSMRVGTNTATDDEKDLSKVSCDLNLYEQYAKGFLQSCGSILTREELELLPYASLVITSEDGIRFLMDHIDGDTYYNIYYPGQNLDRARTQLKLLEDMEEKLPDIRNILKKIYEDLHLDADPWKVQL